MLRILCLLFSLSLVYARENVIPDIETMKCPITFEFIVCIVFVFFGMSMLIFHPYFDNTINYEENRIYTAGGYIFMVPILIIPFIAFCFVIGCPSEEEMNFARWLLVIWLCITVLTVPILNFMHQHNVEYNKEHEV